MNTEQLLLATLTSGTMYALIALGLNLVYGTTRLLNIAHGELVMLGGYVAYLGFVFAGLNPLVSVVLAAALGALAGRVLYGGLLRSLLEKYPTVEQLEANSLLIFFGFSIVVQGLSAWAFSPTAKAYPYLGDVVHIGHAVMTLNRLVATVIGMLCCLGIWLFLWRHPIGLAMRGLIDQRQAARVVGVNIDRVQSMSLMLGFATAGVAGVLISMVEQITPYMGGPLLIGAFVVAIMGGLGRIGGGIVAAFVLSAVETFGVALTSSSFRSILLYGLFVAILLLRPKGLFGRSVAAR
ncbi:LIV-I protein H (plasmid) [Variovorax sp. SRS16]|uniref:branched-chain amino acid ABC transporter permease n=1 Tax=Variovorax sp. SRS16 TaxID=282217 RepID=UPI0013190739|nr:branched-chain amino acid ABC transporter permease [Variovorax sp. SRS16]VTU46698.1 LIV-I protein H [Variovorax sp. SRS16]